MAFYTIDFTVTAGAVTPDTPQLAGHTGDHRAAVVRFSVPFEGYRYRLELTDGSGAYDVTGLLDAKGGKVSCDIPAAWTAAGVATLRLVAVEQGEDGTETVRFHSTPAYLRFEDREEGEPLGDTARPAWQETLDEAQFLLTTVEKKLENGELNGKDGESGVYVGSGEMPAGYSVQIDPAGEVFEAKDFAPAGYGLGKETPEKVCYTLEELDACCRTGWYYTHFAAIGGATFCGVSFNFATVMVVGFGSGTFIQTVYPHPASSKAVLRRYCTSGKFSEWQIVAGS